MLLKLYSSCPFTLKAFLVVAVYSHIHHYWRVRIKSRSDMKYVNLNCSGNLIFRITSVTSTFTVWETYTTKSLKVIIFPIPFRRGSRNFHPGGESEPRSLPLWILPRPSSRRHLSVFIRSGFHTIFALYGKETFSISVQSHLQVHRWCIVHKQPRIRKLSGPDVSCWTWDQGHHREHHFCFLPRFTSVDWEGWSTSHFHLRQARWFQFPHHKLSVPE